MAAKPEIGLLRYAFEKWYPDGGTAPQSGYIPIQGQVDSALVTD